MTVYVDDLIAWPQPAKAGGHVFGSGRPSCHMGTDQADLEELHLLAERIGLRREWFQDHPRYPHYDLTPELRARALLAGAVAVDGPTFIEKTLHLRQPPGPGETR